MTVVARGISPTMGRKIDSNDTFSTCDLAPRDDHRLLRFLPGKSVDRLPPASPPTTLGSGHEKRTRTSLLRVHQADWSGYVVLTPSGTV
jgi:hypothetical protein